MHCRKKAVLIILSELTDEIINRNLKQEDNLIILSPSSKVSFVKYFFKLNNPTTKKLY